MVALRVSPRPAAAAALQQCGRAPALAPLLTSLDLLDLNVLLYRCAAEEADDGGGQYDVSVPIPTDSLPMQCDQPHLSLDFLLPRKGL